MNLKKLIVQNLRAFFYASILTIGFYLLIQILDNSSIIETSIPWLKFINVMPNLQFVFGSLILYILLLGELQATTFWGKKRGHQLEIPIVEKHHEFNHYLLHLFLPSIAYWSLISFVYFNLNYQFWAFFLGIVFIVFSLLFSNIHAYFINNMKIEEETHKIYDFLKIVIYFTGIYSIFEAWYTFNLDNILTSVLIILFSELILFLYVSKYHHLYDSIYILTILAALLAGIITFIILNIKSLISFDHIFVLTTYFFFITGIIHHKIKRDLTFKIFGEYLVLSLFAIAIFIR
ncbi:hypothetical protein KBD45_04520, partial [Candidatus Dojkabacteria bacterium]|nr:hypothetical protein [Candidatus Dojkabacteria bacterium]